MAERYPGDYIDPEPIEDAMEFIEDRSIYVPEDTPLLGEEALETGLFVGEEPTDL